MTDLAASILLLAGGAIALLAGIGLVRMPDLYTRIQAATKASSLGVGCLLVGAALYFGETGVAIRCGLILCFVLLTSPLAAQVLAHAAYQRGTQLWEGTIADEMAGEGEQATEGTRPR